MADKQAEQEHDAWLVEQFEKGVITEEELLRSQELPPGYFDTVVNAGRMVGADEFAPIRIQDLPVAGG